MPTQIPSKEQLERSWGTMLKLRVMTREEHNALLKPGHCDCNDCLHSEEPCKFDCDQDEHECFGCCEMRHAEEELLHEIHCAMGWK